MAATVASPLPVGVFVPAGATDALPMSGHHGAFIAMLERELRRRRTRLMVSGAAGLTDVRAALPGLAGAVLLGFRDEELRHGGPWPVPLVVIDAYAELPAATIVRADDAAGGRRAGRLLVSRGHRDILFAGPAEEGSGVVRERASGFRAALAEAGLPDARRHVTAGTTHREGVALGRRLGKRHPEITAVFAVADTLAIGLMEGLALEGVRVPDDVSVVGFDDLELAAFVTPKLTTVAQDIRRKAVLAAGALLDGHETATGPLTVDVVVIERASVAAR